MHDEPLRGERPRESLPEAVKSMVQAWQAAAAVAGDIANARRTIFLAYVAEGFTEAQALDLVKAL